MISSGELRSVGPFRSLPEEAAAELAKIVRVEKYPEGQIIFEEGQPADSFCVVREGSISVFRQPARGAGSVETGDLAIFGPGACFGEMALLEEKPRIASVRSRTPSVIWRIDRKAFRELLSRRPEAAGGFLLAVVGNLLQRLNATNTALIALQETGRVLAQVPEPAEMMAKCLGILRSQIPAGNGFALMRDPFSGEYEVVSPYGPRCQNAPASVSESEPLLLWHGTSPQPILLEDVSSFPEAKAAGVRFYLAGSLLSAPLVRQEPDRRFLEGCFVFFDLARGVFDYEHMVLASAVASQASLAVEAARRRKEEEHRERLRRTVPGRF